MRIDAPERVAGAVELRQADGLGVVDDLALQVGQRDGVVVDDAERADAGRREILQHRRAKATGADHQHACALQLLLPGAADFRQHDVARIAFEFFRRKGALMAD